MHQRSWARGRTLRQNSRTPTTHAAVKQKQLAVAPAHVMPTRAPPALSAVGSFSHPSHPTSSLLPLLPPTAVPPIFPFRCRLFGP